MEYLQQANAGEAIKYLIRCPERFTIFLGFCSQIEFNPPDNFKCKFAIDEEIGRHMQQNRWNVSDGNGAIRFDYMDSKTMITRYGLLLHGKPGSSRSLMAEIISNKFNKEIFLVNLNSEDMSDAVLITLSSTVPPNSIIMFDEIDKQLRTIIDSKKQETRIINCD